MTTERAGEPEQMVTAVRVQCKECRRARGAARARARSSGGAKGELPGAVVDRCPHYETIWAPGYGPDAEPPPDSGWSDRTPPV